jgi:hypothetical protein
MALLPALLATAGITASLLSSLGCETIKITPNARDASYFQNITERVRDIFSGNPEDTFDTFRFGLFYHREIKDVINQTDGERVFAVTNQCVEYKSGLKIDVAWKAAQAFAIVAPIAAGILTINLYIAPFCIFYTRTTWSTLAFLFILIIPGLQSLTLLFMISNACTRNPVARSYLGNSVKKLRALTTAPTNDTTANGIDYWKEPWDGKGKGDNTWSAIFSVYLPWGEECEMDWGYYANVVSMMLLCAVGIVMLIMGAPMRPPPKEQEVNTATSHQ